MTLSFSTSSLFFPIFGLVARIPKLLVRTELIGNCRILGIENEKRRALDIMPRLTVRMTFSFSFLLRFWSSFLTVATLKWNFFKKRAVKLKFSFIY